MERYAAGCDQRHHHDLGVLQRDRVHYVVVRVIDSERAKHQYDHGGDKRGKAFNLGVAKVEERAPRLLLHPDAKPDNERNKRVGKRV